MRPTVTRGSRGGQAWSSRQRPAPQTLLRIANAYPLSAMIAVRERYREPLGKDSFRKSTSSAQLSP